MLKNRFEELVQEFLGKQRIAIWGVEDAKSIDESEQGK